jgi:hypothetical protein
MGFKKYIISTIVLLGIIGAYVYSLDLGEYTINIDTQIEAYVLNKTLPIYLWIILPAMVLFVFSLGHMFYYGFKGYFVKQAFLHDINAMNIYIKDRIINETSNKKLKTKEVQKIADILNQLEINPIKEDITTNNEELQDIVKKIYKINNNEFVALKSLRLNNNNIIVKKNLKNRVTNDKNFAFEVLKTTSKYDDDIVEIAFSNVLENKSLDKIKTILEDMTLSNKMLTKLLLKDSTSSAEDRFTNSEILSLIQEHKLSNKDLINIAKNYKRTMQPEQLIKLFEDISASDETLTESYLYVLFEYEMLTNITEILVNSQKDEYIVFKALIDLKDAGKHYSVENLSLS